MFLQIASFYGLFAVFAHKLKHDILSKIAGLLLSINAVSNAVSFYVASSLLTGHWTYSSDSGSISPVRWLACMSFPPWAASRSLGKGSVTASGALAVLQIGFILAATHLGFFAAFAATLILNENKNRPKNYLNMALECGLAVHAALFLLLEAGPARADISGLDFRTEFLSTWLSLIVVGSFSVTLESDLKDSVIRSTLRGCFVGLWFYVGVVLAGGSQERVSQSNVAVVGALGGALGATISPLLAKMTDVNVHRDSESKPDSYSLQIMCNVFIGFLLPRIALSLDSSDFLLWQTWGKLSA